MAILELNNVNKTYFGGYVALQDVSFSLCEQEVMTVYGKRGSGKSTLLKAIATLEDISSGSIKIDGKSVYDIGTEHLNISFATSELPLFNGKSVYDNLAYPLKIRKKSPDEIKSRVLDISSAFDLDNILDEKVKYLSSVLKARIIIARAFVKESDFYLFDNVLENFNATERDEVLSVMSFMLSRVKGGVIYATDRLDEVTTINGANCIVLDYGNMADKGDISDIYAHPSTLSSSRLISRGRANEFVRRVQKDERGYFIDVFGRHNIDIDDVYYDRDIVALVNGEDVMIEPISGQNDDNIGIVTHVYRSVDHDDVIVQYGDEEIVAICPNRHVTEGIDVHINVDNIQLFDIVAERRIITIKEG